MATLYPRGYDKVFREMRDPPLKRAYGRRTQLWEDGWFAPEGPPRMSEGLARFVITEVAKMLPAFDPMTVRSHATESFALSLVCQAAIDSDRITTEETIASFARQRELTLDGLDRRVKSLVQGGWVRQGDGMREPRVSAATRTKSWLETDSTDEPLAIPYYTLRRAILTHLRL